MSIFAQILVRFSMSAKELGNGAQSEQDKKEANQNALNKVLQ